MCNSPIRACQCQWPDDERYQAPAQLAGPGTPPAMPVTDGHQGAVAGDRTGVAFGTPTPVAPTVAPPPAPPIAAAPQRPAMHPAWRRLGLVRPWSLFPLLMGHHGDIERQMNRSEARQLGVEMRGSILRAAPEPVDPNWSEVVGGVQ